MTNLVESLPLLLLKARENSISLLRPIFTDYGLTEQQWRVIKVVEQFGEINAQELASETCILSPSLSRIIARLDAEGILIRRTDTVDQRAISLRLSAKGKRLHKKIAPKLKAQYQTLTQTVGKETISDLVCLLQDFSAVEIAHR
ncbi:MAG: homoprotocatechuate degradation operon regulator HpaR [Cellvibrionaceae bacterium]|nr:homoprotocatechuate degradation operon regulator HpaR [Cellvibrionaceae bacterium]